MKFSIAETIDQIIEKVISFKKGSLTHPITILSPNTSLIHSIKRALLESNHTMLNVRVETFYQHITRSVEKSLLDNGIPVLNQDNANAILHKVIESVKLEYFKSAKDFSSYIFYLLKTLNDLSKEVPEEKIEASLELIDTKGKELYQIYKAYKNAKCGKADYADMISLYKGTNETLILFPDILYDFSLLEKKALNKGNNVFYADFCKAKTKPSIELKNPLYNTLEVKDVFKQIISLNASVDKAAIIAPYEYYSLIFNEAEKFNINVYCPYGQDINKSIFEIFFAVLGVIDSDYSYPKLKRFFQLKGQFSQLKALTDCNIAQGLNLIKNSLNILIEKKTSTRLVKLKDTLGLLEKTESLKDSYYEMGSFIIENFIPESFQKNILKALLDNINTSFPNIDYEKWKILLYEKILHVKNKSKTRKGSLLLTSQYLPGVFDYIFFLAIKDGSFPSLFREDPILLDHERQIINDFSSGTLKTAQNKNNKSGQYLNLSISCTKKGWFGYFPGMDIISGDEQFPSFYLIDVVKNLLSQNVISKNEYNDYLNNIKIPWMLNNPDQCLDYTDWSIYHLINETKDFIDHIFLKQKSALDHFHSNTSYWSSTYNEYCGFIDLDVTKKAEEPFSATQLESFMTCPYKWFIKRKLGIYPLDEPFTLEEDNPLTKGSIIHDVLEAYMKQVKDKKEADINSIANEIINEYIAKSGDVALVYQLRMKNKIQGFIDSFNKHEQEYIKDGRKPEYFELAFGTKHKKNMIDDPVTLEIGGHQFKLNGSIDRIDICNNEAFIIDYKSSKKDKYKDASYFDKGKRLQPSLYSEALLKIMGEKHNIKTIYSGYLPLVNNFEEFLFLHDTEQKEKLEEIINFIFAAMKKGYFFTTANCKFCDYTNVCGKGIALASKNKLENADNDKIIGNLAKQYKNFEGF